MQVSARQFILKFKSYNFFFLDIVRISTKRSGIKKAHVLMHRIV